MLHKVEAREWTDMLFHGASEEGKSWLPPVLQQITMTQAPALGPARAMILGVIAYRTLGQGRVSEDISLQEIADTTGISLRSVQMSIGELIDHNWLEAYELVNGKGKNGATNRRFAINFTTLFGVPTTGAKFAGVTHEYIYRYYVPHISLSQQLKLLLSPAAPSTVAEVRKPNGEVGMLATPKKVRPRVSGAETIAEVIARGKASHTEKQTTRAAAAEVKAVEDISKLRKEELQAMCDSLTAQYETQRLLVTGKEFSVFCKRFVLYRVSSLSGFLRYSISMWTTLAAQNQRKFRKDGEHAKGTPMPLAPNFKTLAFRFPYFAACFANQAANDGLKVDPKQAEIDRLTRAVKDRNATIDALQQQALQRRPPPRLSGAAVPHRITRSAPKPMPEFENDDDLKDVYIPTWDEQEAIKQSRG